MFRLSDALKHTNDHNDGEGRGIGKMTASSNLYYISCLEKTSSKVSSFVCRAALCAKKVILQII